MPCFCYPYTAVIDCHRVKGGFTCACNNACGSSDVGIGRKLTENFFKHGKTAASRQGRNNAKGQYLFGDSEKPADGGEKISRNFKHSRGGKH